MSSAESSAVAYMDEATAIVIAGSSESLAQRVGSLVGHERWTDGEGHHWLQIRAELELYPGVEIRYGRIVLPATGPEMAPGGEATIFISGFEERLDTRLHRTAPVDGVVTL